MCGVWCVVCVVWCVWVGGGNCHLHCLNQRGGGAGMPVSGVRNYTCIPSYSRIPSRAAKQPINTMVEDVGESICRLNC